METPKTLPQSDDVWAFLENIDDPNRRADSIELAKLMQKITGVDPVMWGSTIVGFGTHHYKYATGREGDTVAVGFAPRKTALVLYGVVYYEQNANLAEKLGLHTVGKGCLYIKELAKINKETLAGMISVAFKQRNSL